MKRLLMVLPLILVLALGALFYGSLGRDESIPSALISKPFPAFELPVLGQDGEMMTEKDLQGQISLVNVWATWCPTCYVEHPYFMELGKQGVVIFGMNYKDDEAKAEKWLADLGDPYTTTFVDKVGRLGIDLGVRGAPETFLVDDKGVIRYKHEGELNERVWKNTFQPLLAELKVEHGGGQ
ncbi:DsbE family thiol:disulfide interchange protein [Parendozoicomonas haliclonae]|uniref:Thiol:disulfide interchange protein DsbE n=1 Tax=Parendozoicomonas haliclonae TaxID=1960125 RepID=A0A1X7AHN5_9GAMM|nr:DsbE family thiol:disulfide interchange protein [Parendozoicomonas haliclonae]SMA41905.1 Thiol:disulfide interchange protein DsbE [Parendozoicomonas haliclonae]